MTSDHTGTKNSSLKENSDQRRTVLLINRGPEFCRLNLYQQGVSTMHFYIIYAILVAASAQGVYTLQ